MFKNSIIVVSIFIAPIVAISVHILIPDLNWGIDFSIGLLCSIISLQIDTNLKLDKSLDKRRVYENLWLILEKNEWLNKTISEIIHSSHITINKANNEFFLVNLKNELESIANKVSEISTGKIEDKFENIEPLIYACEIAKKEILAVSVSNVDGPKWWNSPQGKKYLQENIKSVKRGVKLVRVFIYDDSTLIELEKVMKEHKDNGIEVHKVHKNNLSPEMKNDIIIFDSHFAYEAKLNSEGIPITNVYYIEDNDISSRLKHFNIIRSMSEIV